MNTARPPLPAPDWINEPPDKWPPAARLVFGILANIAERELAEKAKREQEQPAPGAAHSQTDLARRLDFWFASGVRSAHGLDARLAAEFGISLAKATATRKGLGYRPAYPGGPLVSRVISERKH